MHQDYDELLEIHTANTSVRAGMSLNYNDYEATPYSIIYTLFQQYQLDATDQFVDVGCGKGRMLYYVHNYFGASVTGIEMNERLYKKAVKNKASYLQHTNRKDGSITIKHCYAEEYEVKKKDNIFYFFNPFSIDILRKVIQNISHSINQKRRDVDLIFYYPTKEFIHYLENKTPFKLVQEVQVPGLYRINNDERFLIFRYTG